MIFDILSPEQKREINRLSEMAKLEDVGNIDRFLNEALGILNRTMKYAEQELRNYSNFEAKKEIEDRKMESINYPADDPAFKKTQILEEMNLMIRHTALHLIEMAGINQVVVNKLSSIANEINLKNLEIQSIKEDRGRSKDVADQLIKFFQDQAEQLKRERQDMTKTAFEEMEKMRNRMTLLERWINDKISEKSEALLEKQKEEITAERDDLKRQLEAIKPKPTKGKKEEEKEEGNGEKPPEAEGVKPPKPPIEGDISEKAKDALSRLG